MTDTRVSKCSQTRHCKNIPSQGKICDPCMQIRIRHKLKLKQIVLDTYGPCACCGESEPAFLCVDHVAGGGNTQREQVFGHKKAGGIMMYRWLIKNDFPEGFQVLCFNCNCAKQYNPGGCPHGG